ncbi:beta-defensin 103A-like [Delphinus delphis]|uniref:beta-defensin 103A-like n=1 Tax=Delphinus delphis TaxID=9728 RepID=UPI0028C50F35|nr:beta-defensin 103A-like [Delphinus delphis]
MRVYYLLFVLFFLFLLPVSGSGRIVNILQKYYCRVRGGRCALFGCLPREIPLGLCSHSGRKCCRRER